MSAGRQGQREVAAAAGSETAASGGSLSAPIALRSWRGAPAHDVMALAWWAWRPREHPPTLYPIWMRSALHPYCLPTALIAALGLLAPTACGREGRRARRRLERCGLQARALLLLTNHRRCSKRRGMRRGLVSEAWLAGHGRWCLMARQTHQAQTQLACRLTRRAAHLTEQGHNRQLPVLPPPPPAGPPPLFSTCCQALDGRPLTAHVCPWGLFAQGCRQAQGRAGKGLVPAAWPCFSLPLCCLRCLPANPGQRPQSAM